MLRCPDCERSDSDLTVVKVQEELTRCTYPVELSVHSGWVQDFETHDPEREVIDTDRDGAMFRCEDCSFETDDAEDFFAVGVDSEDEDC